MSSRCQRNSVDGWTRNEYLPGSRQNLGERRQHRAIGRSQAWASDLPPEHLQLVPQEEDLDLLLPVGTPNKDEQLEQAADRPVDEREALKQQTLSLHLPTVRGAARHRTPPDSISGRGRRVGSDR